MKNTATIKLLEVEMTVLGAPATLHPVLIADDDGVTLVDTLFPGQLQALKRAMEEAGVSLNRLTRVVLTHQDWDHVGLMRELIEACPDGLEIYAHRLEKPYLEGALPYLKLTPARIAARLESMPEEKRQGAAALFASVPNFRVDRTIGGEDVLPFHGGVRIVHTPGHTPGHICLYLEEQRVLIPGDELRVEDGRLVGPNPEHTPNMPEAVESLNKLVGLNVEHVYAFHGGHYAGDISADIRKLAGS